jgi:DNA-binding response OmpR family regulator
MAKIGLCEDDPAIRRVVTGALAHAGHETVVAHNGREALRLFTEDDALDVVVLDIGLPDADGRDVCQALRSAGQPAPVLFLTALGAVHERLAGFSAGADDYLPKPFELAILIARLGGLLRRAAWLRTQAPPPQADAEPTASENVDEYAVGDRTIDFSRLEIRGANGPVRLTAMEADMLRYLIRHEGRVVSRKSLLEELWGLREDTDTRAIDNFVVRLRKYLEEVPSKPRHLLTVRGVGYRFVAEPEE